MRTVSNLQNKLKNIHPASFCRSTSFSKYNDTEHYDFIIRAFKDTFPKYNQSEAERCIKQTNGGIMECVIFNCNNSPAGFIFYRVFQGFSYCEYIGITRKCRGMNFASSLLRYVAGDGRQWILEIEVNSEYDTNSPQVRLFSNNGFSEVPFHYEMPRTDEIYPGAKFRMWSKHTLSQQEFNEIYTTLKEDEYF